MINVDEIVSALKNPQKPAFKVKFEIFASEDRKRIAKVDSTISKELLINSAVSPNDLKSLIHRRDLEQPKSRLLERLPDHQARYDKIKEYFQQKIQELGLTNPLIFFDDKALRIDIGYGPKEVMALFEDFFNYCGVFDEFVLGRVSVFGPSVHQHFIERCMVEDYSKELDSEIKNILESAKSHFEKVNPRQSSLNLNGLNESQIIKTALQNNQGLLIGEVHEHKSPKQFLVDNMLTFKQQGVTILYMEHLFQERHQALLDEYFHAPSHAAMPPELARYLDYLDAERGLSKSASFTAVVKAAKDHQIRVIAIDSEAIYQLGVSRRLGVCEDLSSSQMRYQTMNMSMFELFQRFNDHQKFIAFMGSAHVTTCLGVRGVSDLLNCPHIVVKDLKDIHPEYIEKNSRVNERGNSVYFENMYHRYPVSKSEYAFTYYTLKLYVQAIINFFLTIANYFGYMVSFGAETVKNSFYGR